MSELDKNKAGLQKNVSSVFKGVPVPQNNDVRQPSDTPEQNNTPGVPPKPVSASTQSSLIKKLNQSEDSLEKEEQNQTVNSFQRPAPANRMPQSPEFNKLPQSEQAFKQTEKATQLKSDPFIEETGEGLLQQIREKLFTPKPGSSPARQKVMVIMVPILAIIMIFAFRQVLSKSPRKTKGAGTDDAPVVVAKADTGNEIDWKIPEPIEVIKRDPIKLPEQTDTQNGQENTGQNEAPDKPQQGETIVKDIVYSKDKPSAVIGSTIVYEGDKINDLTIIKINKDSIVFEKEGEKWQQNVRDRTRIPYSEVPEKSMGQLEPVK